MKELKECKAVFVTVGGRKAPFFDDGVDFYYAPNEGFEYFDKSGNFRHTHNYNMIVVSDDEIKVGDHIYRSWGGVTICNHKILDSITGGHADNRDAKKVIAGTMYDCSLQQINHIPKSYCEKLTNTDDHTIFVQYVDGDLELSYNEKTQGYTDIIIMDSKIEPITPKEVVDNHKIPDIVIESTNELLIQNWTGKDAIIKLDDLINRMNYKGNTLSRGELNSKRHLDIEDTYRKIGWVVEFESPDRDSSNFDAYFKFKLK